MLDTVGYLACDFNPCFHEKFDGRKLQPATYVVETDPGTDATTTWYFPDEGGFVVKGLPQALRELELPNTPEWMDQLFAKADLHFITAVEDNVSLLNFLIELIEMCEGNIKKLKETGEKLLVAIKKYFQYLAAHPGKFWLAWNFAIRPTFGDLFNLYNSLKRAQKRFHWLQTRNHLDTKVAYRQSPLKGDVDLYLPLDSVQGPLQQPPSAYPNPFPSSLVKVSLTYEIRPTCWAWVRFDIPDYLLNNELGLGVVWMAINGLYNPAKVIWEAIPFSWLIDWFRSLRNRLLIEKANFSPLKDAIIHQKGCTFKLHVKGRLELQDDTKRTMGTFTYDTFVRRPGYPELDVQPIRVPHGWYEESILTALIAKKHRRWRRYRYTE